MATKGNIVAATTPFTGSIAKIYAPAACNIHSVAFGTNTKPYTTTASTVANVAIPAGFYLEGPIIQYSASVLTVAYLEK